MDMIAVNISNPTSAAAVEIDTTEWMNSPVAVDGRVLAVGDVHGRADLLAAIEDRVVLSAQEAAAEQPGAPVRYIRLGDYIDRGPANFQAIDFARGLRLRAGLVAAGLPADAVQDTSLAGNHEQLLMKVLRATDGELTGAIWLWFRNGGSWMAKEFEWTQERAMGLPTVFLRDLMDALGNERLAFLNDLAPHVRMGMILFIHAGVNPTVPLEETLSRDIWHLPRNDREEALHPLWVRGQFLTWPGPMPDDVFVIHGHTITEKPDIRSNRINLDTGAYGSDQLTALELRGSEMRFHFARGTWC